jgi:hypothetical protein
MTSSAAMASVGVALKHPDVPVLSLGRDVPARRILIAHRHDRVRAPAELAMHQVLVEVAREYQTRP